MAEHTLVSEITEDEFRAANARGRRAVAQGPVAVAARLEPGVARRIVVELANGCAFAFPADQAERLAGATEADLAVIEVSPAGLALHWPRLDADLLVPALVRGVLGSREWMSRIGRAGGQSKSPAKSQAARDNGKKGGRPSKATREASSA